MKRLILIFVFVITLVSLILYYTYAIDVSMESTTGAVDLVLNIDIKDPSSRTVTVEAGKTKVFDFILTNNNGTTINYGIAYSGTKPSTVKIAQANSSKDPVSGTISNNATKYVTIVIENKSSTNYTYTLLPVSGYQNGGSLIISSGYTLITDIYNMLPMNANDYIMSLSQGDSWSSGASGVYQTNGHEYRYVGANVNNYVKFNDDMYRIIGVFDDNSHGVTGQNLVKLIRARILDGYSRGATNVSPAYTTYSGYNNNWEIGSANILLNEFFLNANNTSTTYGSCSDWTYFGNGNDYKTLDCSNIVGYGIQTNNLRNYIQSATWYLKGFESGNHSKQDNYTCERSDTTTIENCSIGSNQYPKKLENKSIGLMYVSDYLYASGYFSSSDTTVDSSIDYGIQNWLYKGREWTITPVTHDYEGACIVDEDGSVGCVYNYDCSGLRPTFYLKSTIIIQSGDGSFNDPYIIG